MTTTTTTIGLARKPSTRPQPLQVESDHGISTTSPPLDTATLLKLISAGFSFFVAGVNDGSIGTLIPHVMGEYGISTAVVSALYAANLLGWLLAAVSNTHLGQRLGLGAMLALGAALQTAAQALRAWPTPPFGLYVFTFCLTSLGQAFQDTHANTFVASGLGGGGRPASSTTPSTKGHRWLAFIHALYMAGCLAGPFCSASIASLPGAPWYLFYTVPLGLGLVNLALVLVAFRDSIRLLRHHGARSSNNNNNNNELTIRDESYDGNGTGPQDDPRAAASMGARRLMANALGQRSVWLLSLFFFFYLGTTVTAGGWVVEYLVDVRNGDLAQMGYVPAGFSGGCLLGRIVLSEPTHRWGERPMVLLYCALCLAFQLVFWLVPNIVAASVAISFLGFFSGPLFAAAVSVATKIFPPEIRATALSFVFVFAQTGGSFFPIATGVLGAHVGVSVMQPVLVGLISATAVTWLLVPHSQAKME